MATERLWYTDADIALSDITTSTLTAKSILWAIKAVLLGQVTGTHGTNGAPQVGSRWTCIGSSDSVTAGLDDTDRWGASFDASKLVRASSGVHSWIALKSPVALGPYYLIIDWLTSIDPNCSFIFCKTAPTGGTTSARPTSTDEWLHTNKPFFENVAAAHNIHRVTDASGNFYINLSRTGTGRVPLGLCFQALADVRIAGDLYPVFTALDMNATTTPAGSLSCFNSTVSASTFCGAAGAGRMHNGSSVVSLSALSYKSASTGGDPMASKDANADGKRDSLPVFIECLTPGATGQRGRLPDVGWGPALFAQGSRSPATGSIEFIFIGNLYVPYDVALTL